MIIDKARICQSSKIVANLESNGFYQIHGGGLSMLSYYYNPTNNTFLELEGITLELKIPSAETIKFLKYYNSIYMGINFSRIYDYIRSIFT